MLLCTYCNKHKGSSKLLFSRRFYGAAHLDFILIDATSLEVGRETFRTFQTIAGARSPAVKTSNGDRMKTKISCPNVVPVKPIYSVKEFTCQHGISRALFYKLLQDGKGPRIIKAGKRTLITNEAAEDWRRSLEKAA